MSKGKQACSYIVNTFSWHFDVKQYHTHGSDWCIEKSQGWAITLLLFLVRQQDLEGLIGFVGFDMNVKTIVNKNGYIKRFNYLY